MGSISGSHVEIYSSLNTQSKWEFPSTTTLPKKEDTSHVVDSYLTHKTTFQCTSYTDTKITIARTIFAVQEII